MSTQVIKVDRANIDGDQIELAAKLIDRGGLVAFPTETVYGIGCRAKNDSISRLNSLKDRDPSKHYTLHIGRKEDYLDYVPSASLRVRKLIENAWPGPVTIVFDLDGEAVERKRGELSDEVFSILYKNNSLGIRCPDDVVASALLKGAAFPVVAPSANRAGEPPSTDAGGVLEAFEGQLDLVLDGGETRLKAGSTVVRVKKDGIEVLREGPYSESDIRRMSTVQILFVCTGNSCRSPMAEGLFANRLAEKLHSSVDKLGEIGYKVLSAGTMQLAGMPASREAVVACSARGVDISSHQSSAVSEELLMESDLVFVMTRGHLEQLNALCPEARDKCRLLAECKDISDPIGFGQAFYNECADEIEGAVEKIIDGLWK